MKVGEGAALNVAKETRTPHAELLKGRRYQSLGANVWTTDHLQFFQGNGNPQTFQLLPMLTSRIILEEQRLESYRRLQNLKQF